MKWGDAPCDKCNRFDMVRLTGHEEPAEDGGKYFECVPGQACPDCGQEWNWLHQPSADDLMLPEMRHEEIEFVTAVGVAGVAVEVEG